MARSEQNRRAMLTSVRYFDRVRETKNAYNHRLPLVESAKHRGIKPTARLFATIVPTVRKWLRRFEQHGPSGLVALPRARHHQSQKTPPTTEAQLVELRKTLPTFGPRRLIREFDLPISHCHRAARSRSPLELCLLPPAFLDYYLNDSGGYDVGRLP